MAKLLTTNALIRINLMSVRKGFNRTLNTDVLHSKLDPEGIHVIGDHFLHNDTQIRCTLLLKRMGQEEPDEAVLDILVDQFNELPDYDDIIEKADEGYYAGLRDRESSK